MASFSIRLKIWSVSIVLVIISILHPTHAIIKLPQNVTIPAVFAFGDSIMDTGNNNHLDTIVKSDFPPYGKDFLGGIPTGRFCNGKVPSDLIAEELGVKEFLPAYNSYLQPNDLVTGVCFASGASGYDPLTPQLMSVLSMSQQLELFKQYIAKLRSVVGDDRTNFILANSVYLVVSGSDDIANTYFTARVRQLQYDLNSYTDLMLNGATDFIKELYGLGARRMGVFSTPPIGCVPSQRTLSGGIERECAEDHNKAAKLFNAKLSTKLDSLNHYYPGSKLVYIDVYNPLVDLIQNPGQYGFKVSKDGCCGTGKIEVSVLCSQFSETCPNASDYVFWDSYHPTERAYRTLISPLLQNYVKNFF